MSDSHPQKLPKEQSASSRNPPRPPTRTERGLADGAPGDYIDVPDPVALADLATALGQDAQKILGDARAFGEFKDIHDKIAYEHAAFIAITYGFDARRVA